MDSHIAVLILAAGGASRMGKPKQLLPVGQTTLLGQIVATAQTISPHIFIVLGAKAQEIQKGLPPQTHIIHNPDWKNGMGTSLALGISYISKTLPSCQGCLVLLADQPLIDPPYLKQVLEMFRTGISPIVATAYHYGAGVPALFSAKFFPELQQCGGDQGAKKLLQQHQEKVFTLFAGNKTLDIDTPEDYHKYTNTSY